MKFYIIIL